MEGMELVFYFSVLVTFLPTTVFGTPTEETGKDNYHWFVIFLTLALISIPIHCIIIAHLWYRMRYRNNPISKILLYPTLILYIANMLSCVTALFRSNIIVKSAYECSLLSLTLWNTLWHIARLSRMLAYLGRLHVVFRGSIYYYEPFLLKAVAIFASVFGILGMILAPYFTNKKRVIRVTPNGDTMCGLKQAFHSQMKILVIVFSVVELIATAVLLGLFIYKLYKLRKSLIQTLEMEVLHLSQMDLRISVADDDDAQQQQQSSVVVAVSTMATPMTEYRKSTAQSNLRQARGSRFSTWTEDNRRRVSELTRVMWKQTILVCVVMGYSFLVLGGMAIYGHIAYLIPTEMIISGVCMHLSFSFTDWIWESSFGRVLHCCPVY